METETERRDAEHAVRWMSWCDECQEPTDSDDTTCRWCAECGTYRPLIDA